MTGVQVLFTTGLVKLNNEKNVYIPWALLYEKGSCIFYLLFHDINRNE